MEEDVEALSREVSYDTTNDVRGPPQRSKTEKGPMAKMKEDTYTSLHPALGNNFPIKETQATIILSRAV
jgi:hypothetical protein